jgi:hypothetical protein
MSLKLSNFGCAGVFENALITKNGMVDWVTETPYKLRIQKSKTKSLSFANKTVLYFISYLNSSDIM